MQSRCGAEQVRPVQAALVDAAGGLALGVDAHVGVGPVGDEVVVVGVAGVGHAGDFELALGDEVDERLPAQPVDDLAEQGVVGLDVVVAAAGLELHGRGVHNGPGRLLVGRDEPNGAVRAVGHDLGQPGGEGRELSDRDRLPGRRAARRGSVRPERRGRDRRPRTSCIRATPVNALAMELMENTDSLVTATSCSRLARPSVSEATTAPSRSTTACSPGTWRSSISRVSCSRSPCVVVLIVCLRSSRVFPARRRRVGAPSCPACQPGSGVRAHWCDA